VRQTSTARLGYTTKEMVDIEVWGEGKIIPISKSFIYQLMNNRVVLKEY
jgi:hypothetical protein